MKTCPHCGYVEPKRDCQLHDYYPTPWWCVDRLLESIPPFDPGARLFEPCAGDGAIMRRVLDWYPGVKWLATDLNPRANPHAPNSLRADMLIHRLDYLSLPRERIVDVDCIITNPPYNLALEFAELALHHCPRVAMLLPLTFGSSKKRADFRTRHPPSQRVLPDRARFLVGETSAPTDYAWFTWGFDPEPVIKYLNTTTKKDRELK